MDYLLPLQKSRALIMTVPLSSDLWTNINPYPHIEITGVLPTSGEPCVF